MKSVVFVMLLLATGTSYAASFDCSKASASYEKTICSDDVLNRMDEALSNNYRTVMNSDRDQTIKDQLKQSQKAWLTKRNACGEYACIRSLYEWRVDEICDKYASSAEKPKCVSTQDISKQINADIDKAKQEDQKNRIPVKEVFQNLVEKYSSQVDQIGFSDEQLSSYIYISMSSNYVRYCTLREYLSLMSDIAGLKSITKIDNDSYFGFKMKVKGHPTTGFTFHVEDDELYLNGLVSGDDVLEAVTAGHANQIANTFYVYAVQLLNDNNAKL